MKDEMLLNKTELEIKEATGEMLVFILASHGIPEPAECMIEEHAAILEVEGGLDYYWDDILLMQTRPLKTFNGLRIIGYEKP